VHDIGHDNEISYMVTEFVEGQTLRQSRPEGLRQQIDVAAQIADALAAAHARGITHRDLKPENIMVTPEGRAKILDFGLAKSSGPVGEEESTQTLPGTVEYISPEQVRGQSADTRSDIFSFGAVLYELFTGQRAFLGGSTARSVASARAKHQSWHPFSTDSRELSYPVRSALWSRWLRPGVTGLPKSKLSIRKWKAQRRN
jgi:serine/threonine protein kinase